MSRRSGAPCHTPVHDWLPHPRQNGKSGSPLPDHLGHDLVEHAPAREPVVPVTERGHAVRARELGLRYADRRNPQVVEPEIGGEERLAVAAVQGPRRGHVGPFGESRSPELVVLRDRVELRQVERDDLVDEPFRRVE